MRFTKVKDWWKGVFSRTVHSDSGNDPSEPSRRLWAKLKLTSGKLSQWLKSHRTPAAIAVGTAGIITAAVFSGIYYVKSNTHDIYHVMVDGQEVGTVSDPQVVKDWLADKRSEVRNEHPNAHMVYEIGEITYRSEKVFKPKPDEQGTLARIDSLAEIYATGVELKVEGKTIGIVKDLATAESIIRTIKEQYIPEEVKQETPKVMTLSASASAATVEQMDRSEETGGISVESIEIVEKVETNQVVTDPDKIADPEEVLRKLQQSDVKPTIYTVQAGDCISCIAEKFNISKQLIYEKNDWIEDDMIRVGDQLDLTVEQPLVTVESVELVTETEEIDPPVVYEKDENMPSGKTKVVKEGKSGTKRVTYRLTKQNGLLMKEELVKEEVLIEPEAKVVRKGTKVIGEGSGRFAWPVLGAKLTSSYGKRWGRLHKGIDLVSSNRSILAADDGKVVFAGVKSGYGNTIIIDHRNGYKTLYGHLSKIGVKVGEVVEKGDKIGVMGSTGQSTGTHLHFEIHKKSAEQNPMKYLSR
jgi:murein DD-endopeptidase MepM/ murein hydrolase activator NlpD